MDKIKLPVYAVTFYLLFYTISYNIGIPYWVTALMYSLSPLLIIWLVISVLKNGEESTRKFDEGHFYDDVNIRGVGNVNH